MRHAVPRRLSPDRKALFHALSRPSLPHTHNKKRGAVFRTPVSNPPVLPAAYAYLRLASGIASGALVSCFTFSVTGL